MLLQCQAAWAVWVEWATWACNLASVRISLQANPHRLKSIKPAVYTAGFFMKNLTTELIRV